MRKAPDPTATQAPPFDPDDPGYGALMLPNAAIPTIIQSWPSEWHGRAAEQGAQVIAAVHDIFLDGSRDLVWVDDRPGVRARSVTVSIDHLRALYGRERVEFREHKTQDRAVAVGPPRDLLSSVITLRPAAASWKLLRGIAPGPYILGDGSVYQEAGWNDFTKLWLSQHSTVDFKKSKVPLLARGFSQETAHKALCLLLEPLAEVPWADERLDQTVWLAYVLTLAARPAFDTVPFFLIEASLPGSGKDFLLKAAEISILGDFARRVNLEGGKDGAKEDQNRIATPIEEGEANFVLADLKDLGNPLLLSLITEGSRVSIRRLGVQRSIPVPYCLTIAGTGNNITINVPDIVRRTIHLRLEPATEDPENRVFGRQQDDILAEFAADRATTLTVCFNVLRGWLHSGATKPEAMPCTAFPAWASTVQHALIWAGFEDVLKTQPRMKISVPQTERDEARVLLLAWHAVRGNKETTTNDIELYRRMEHPNTEEAAFLDAIAALGDDKPLSKKALAAKLKTFRGKTCRHGEPPNTSTTRFQMRQDARGVWHFWLSHVR